MLFVTGWISCFSSLLFDLQQRLWPLRCSSLVASLLLSVLFFLISSLFFGSLPFFSSFRLFPSPLLSLLLPVFLNLVFPDTRLYTFCPLTCCLCGWFWSSGALLSCVMNLSVRGKSKHEPRKGGAEGKAQSQRHKRNKELSNRAWRGVGKPSEREEQTVKLGWTSATKKRKS